MQGCIFVLVKAQLVYGLVTRTTPGPQQLKNRPKAGWPFQCHESGVQITNLPPQLNWCKVAFNTVPEVETLNISAIFLRTLSIVKLLDYSLLPFTFLDYI